MDYLKTPMRFQGLQFMKNTDFHIKILLQK